ncbi:hypothetical protein GF108_17955 [Phyllobacterium sp. SYP-B3895]|jgi:hypothetical protein|uniref:Uncharacterized protein n=2 Tax=Phyllobacterium TaxID=28100 RepID=A0A849VTA0_9HYPH|nr:MULTISPECIES: hypothetical protein [Phyllobacterium]MRG57455.1 hypothetical protein [Phyllobacterium sp. SYP-B3895]NTS33205.1 hypothetical protein [Phyllobacterium pellucidum]
MMTVQISPPSRLATHSVRESDCVEAIRARFEELHDPGEDYIDLIREAMAAGWTMREARLALNKLLGLDLRDQEQH